MEQQEPEQKYLINMDVDSSMEFFKGFGLKQIKHFFLLVVPILLITWYFPIHHKNDVVDFILRLFGVLVIGFLGSRLVIIKRFRGCGITMIEILESRIQRNRRIKKGQNISRYNKLRTKK